MSNTNHNQNGEENMTFKANTTYTGRSFGNKSETQITIKPGRTRCFIKTECGQRLKVKQSGGVEYVESFHGIIRAN
tara:strand:- start:260 stop:487 length:228 start_codon:yes stop_codon:yes gene_type:complete